MGAQHVARGLLCSERESVATTTAFTNAFYKGFWCTFDYHHLRLTIVRVCWKFSGLLVSARALPGSYRLPTQDMGHTRVLLSANIFVLISFINNIEFLLNLLNVKSQ